jgi:diaminohydroxyphosphoribosylaminopyrimidine deaminase/5-amino-6-(5-phosphoribosylamino)uracil reductase
VLLKLAQTADGFAARLSGPRLYITGERSNCRTHLIRAHADAIMVGVGTVLADDPQLTVRLPGLEDRSPVRVILDSRLRTPEGAYVVRTGREVPTWVVAADDAPIEPERRLAAAGVEVMRVPSRGGRLDLAEALTLLASRGITRVFSEGGPRLGDTLVELDLVDEFALATSDAPLGEPGVPAIGSKLRAALRDRFRLVSTEDLGPDRLEVFERAD